jgi:large subunit ribosomal protein L6
LLIFTKMKKKLERNIEFPSTIQVSINGDEITVKGNGKESKRRFNMKGIKANVENGKINLVSEKATRRESKMMGTIWAHVKNMIKGINEDFIYEMEICNVHFPMNVKQEGNKVVIKSFLGEKNPRFASILPHTKVDIKGSTIVISSHIIENAGQTATNIEKATRVVGRDRRIFQDGIFITKKLGEKI